MKKNLLLNSNQFLRIETFCTKYFAPQYCSNAATILQTVGHSSQFRPHLNKV